MSMYLKKNKIFYWANSELKNDGEGILANNFLFFLTQIELESALRLEFRQTFFPGY